MELSPQPVVVPLPLQKQKRHTRCGLWGKWSGIMVLTKLGAHKCLVPIRPFSSLQLSCSLFQKQLSMVALNLDTLSSLFSNKQLWPTNTQHRLRRWLVAFLNGLAFSLHPDWKPDESLGTRWPVSSVFPTSLCRREGHKHWIHAMSSQPAVRTLQSKKTMTLRGRHRNLRGEMTHPKKAFLFSFYYHIYPPKFLISTLRNNWQGVRIILEFSISSEAGSGKSLRNSLRFFPAVFSYSKAD